MGDDAQAFGPHAWNEVVVNGLWQPVDATWAQAEIDATHIRISLAEDPIQIFDVLGQVAFELLAVERER